MKLWEKPDGELREWLAGCPEPADPHEQLLFVAFHSGQFETVVAELRRWGQLVPVRHRGFCSRWERMGPTERELATLSLVAMAQNGDQDALAVLTQTALSSEDNGFLLKHLAQLPPHPFLAGHPLEEILFPPLQPLPVPEPARPAAAPPPAPQRPQMGLRRLTGPGYLLLLTHPRQAPAWLRLQSESVRRLPGGYFHSTYLSSDERFHGSGQSRHIRVADLSPSGDLLTLYCHDGTLDVLDVASGQLLQRAAGSIPELPPAVSGQHSLQARDGGQLLVLRGQQQVSCIKVGADLLDYGFSLDGQWVLTAGPWAVNVWSLEGEWVTTLHPNGAPPAAPLPEPCLQTLRQHDRFYDQLNG